jgi:beta-N-acetylhexosaminidase
MKGGELLFVGVEGTRLTAAEAGLLGKVLPAGVVLVQRNIADEETLRMLMAELRAAVPGATLALDAEGGPVDRLRGVVGPAPGADLLALQAPARARRAGYWVGAALAGLGFDLDLAPVVDLDHGRAGNALDRRTFGADPRRVASRAGAFLDGLHAAGIGGCLKHFPGLGAAGADTHVAPAAIGLDADALARDRAPFAALAARAEAVMAGHAVYPALDPEARPATLSRALCTGLLRRSVRFRGALLSDDLEMGALAPWGELPERGREALAAGCDGLLFCRRIEAAPEIAAALGARSLAGRRAEAGRRLARLRGGLARRRAAAQPPPPLARVREALARLGERTAIRPA